MNLSTPRKIEKTMIKPTKTQTMRKNKKKSKNKNKLKKIYTKIFLQERITKKIKMRKENLQPLIQRPISKRQQALS